jgi:hypothetical protein
MAYQYPEIKRFLGLFAQANSFSLPEGAMEKALNVVINDDNVISKTRGFYDFFEPASGTLNELFLYQQHLIAVYQSKASYFTETGSSPNEVGTETVLTGETVALSGGRRARATEQNGNLYFTSDNGVLKLDSFSGKVFKAGAPAALDVRGNFLPLNGPIAGETQIALRVLFGRRDENQNLIVGAPSDILILTNQKRIDLAYSSSGAGPYTVSVTAPNHNLSTGMTVVVSDATDTDANGTYTVTVTGVNTFTYSTANDPTTGTLAYAATRAGLYEFSIPPQITSANDGWFYQIYRTTQSSGSNVSPQADFRLIDERPLRSDEVTARLVIYQDEVDDILVDFAPELYTNPNSREGELQANFQPPLCEDITLFNSYVFYGNCISRQILNFDVIDTSAITSGSFVEIKVNDVTRRYVARSGVGNRTVRSESLTDNAGSLQVNYVAHGFSNGDRLYVSTISGGTLTPGFYFVVSATANSFELSLTSGGSSVAFNSEGFLFFAGVSNGTYPIFQVDNVDLSISIRLRNTAQGLVRAINRDSQSPVTANYTSSITDTPGKIRLTGKAFTGVIFVRAETLAVGEGFAPELPDSFSVGEQVKSQNDIESNTVYISKVGEPEAVPVVNKISVGSRNQPISRIVALRNSVIVLKQDGVFKITGDNPLNFTVTALDTTIKVIAPDSARAVNNQVYFLSGEGVCIATDSSVQIVSRRIENKFEQIVGLPNISEITTAVAYDTDRTYRICTAGPASTTATINYFHNVVNDTWTESDELFSGGVVGPNNALFLISLDNKIRKERKKGTRIDFSGENHAVTVVSIEPDKLSGLITSLTRVPDIGDIIVKDEVITRIESVSIVSGSTYRITFLRESNLDAGNTTDLYERLVSEIKMAPYHAGLVQRTKQFAQLQLHTRSPSISRIQCSFTGQTFGGSAETDWRANKITGASGWGFEPWGYFPFGLTDSINNFTSTEPAPVVRLFVPLFQQRNSFIQANLIHREGGEAMDIQAMSWAVRAYQERVTK